MDPLRRALVYRFLSRTRHYHNATQVKQSAPSAIDAPPFGSLYTHDPPTSLKKARNQLRSDDAVNSEPLATSNTVQCTTCGDQFYGAFTLAKHLADMPKDHISFQQCVDNHVVVADFRIL